MYSPAFINSPFLLFSRAENIKVKKVTMLGTKGKIKWQRTDAELIVIKPAKKISGLAIVFKLTTEWNRCYLFTANVRFVASL
jgi:hypothetical protein